MNAELSAMSITTGKLRLSCRAKSRHPVNLPVGYAAGFLDSARNDAASNMFQRIFIAVFVSLAAAQLAFADSPSVTAVLSNSETAVGETVEIQIKVTGPGDAQPPEEISIDGLEIHATGQSRQFEMHNFSTSSSVTYNYTI